MNVTVTDAKHTFVFRDIDELFTAEFGEEYVTYRKKWNAVAYDNIPSAPLHIDITPMDLCNLSCSFCPRNPSVENRMNEDLKLEMGLGKNREKMSLATYSEIMRQGKHLGIKAINLGSGAEPLVHPQIVEMVQMARQHGFMDIRIITNGHLLSPKMSEKLMDAGLTYLSVSMDAFYPETYKKLRGRELQPIVNNLLYALEYRKSKGYRLPTIRASYIGHPESAAEFIHFVDFWKTKVDFIEVQDLVTYEADHKKDFVCLEPFRRLWIWPNGSAGCLAWTSKLGENVTSFGNIFEKPIQDIWNGEKIKEMRRALIEKEYYMECRTCIGSEMKVDINLKEILKRHTSE